MWALIIIIAIIVICLCAKQPAATPKPKEKPDKNTELSDDDIFLMRMLDDDK